jgi:hypothetical protein
MILTTSLVAASHLQNLTHTIGRPCRDAFLGLLLTCAKLGVSFWAYLGHRLGVPGADAPYLPDVVRLRSTTA